MTRIFISHPRQYQELTEYLSRHLNEAGLQTVMDALDSTRANDILHHILYNVESSDIVLLLISNDTAEGRWIKREVDQLLKHKLKSRNISLIPVFVGKRYVLNPLSEYVSFSIQEDRHSDELNGHSKKSLDKIISYLKNSPKVNLDHLDPLKFENLIVCLLDKLRFFDIERQHSYQDYGFDIAAKTRIKNPFGGYATVTWLIEIKFYRSSRADINSLQQISYYLRDKSLDVNGVLITNGLLTSTAKEWLEFNEKERRVSITVVDGVKLKQLILKFPDVVELFFGSERENV